MHNQSILAVGGWDNNHTNMSAAGLRPTDCQDKLLTSLPVAHRVAHKLPSADSCIPIRNKCIRMVYYRTFSSLSSVEFDSAKHSLACSYPTIFLRVGVIPSRFLLRVHKLHTS